MENPEKPFTNYITGIAILIFISTLLYTGFRLVDAINFSWLECVAVVYILFTSKMGWEAYYEQKNEKNA